MAAAIKIPSIFTAVDKYSAPVNRMSKATTTFANRAEVAVARADRSFRRLMTPVRRLTGALGNFGMILGTTAIVSGMVSMVNVFKDFEQANANLASVMSEPPEKMAMLREQAKMLGATTSKTATEVVELQEAFARLGFGADDISNMTKATIDGSVAMRGGLSETAEMVGAMVNSFDNLSSSDASMIIDQLTMSTQKSALNFEKLQTSLPIVAGAANAAGVPFNRLLALLGKLSDAGIDASSSATSLRNIFIEAAGQGLTYDQILDKIVNSQDKLTTAFDETGKRAAVPAAVLANKLKETVTLSDELQNSFEGTAARTAEKQLQTLGGAITILGSAYEGWILSLEDGNGAFSQFLTKTVQVITEIFSLMSGTAAATSELDKNQQSVRSWANLILGAGKVIAWLIGGLILFKTITLAVSAALAIQRAVGSALFFIDMVKYISMTQGISKATALWQIVQTSLNAAMAANPIGLITIAIMALIAVVAIVISKWDEWGAALSLFLGPLGLVISMIQSFRRNWEMVTTAFQSGGILAGIKAIGKVLLDSILMPLQQLLELASSIPGAVGKMAAAGASKIEAFRQDLGVETGPTGGAEERQVVNPELERQQALAQTIQTTQTQNVNIGIADETGRATVNSDNDIIPIKMTPTWNAAL